MSGSTKRTIKYDFGSNFGPFGAKLSEAIASHVDELGELLAAGDDEPAFQAKYDEINQLSYDVFREFVDAFVTALAGYLAYHGGNNVALEGVAQSRALIGMAYNANTIMTEIATSALFEAEAWLSRADPVVDEAVDRLFEQLVADIGGDLKAWVVTTGEHSLADLFPPTDVKHDA